MVEYDHELLIERPAYSLRCKSPTTALLPGKCRIPGEEIDSDDLVEGSSNCGFVAVGVRQWSVQLTPFYSALQTGFSGNAFIVVD
ncbi:unnamed protein product [Heligmosomoides polygyrus]|uniref:Peptidase S1 domain-containing protein n=1 Tax=Heligmosomoides polygyrus TaxID=6339 RepID=A0A183FDH8_HELPZ|nr:unnamed protein product [Heligmosomoides polygyrus]